MAKGNMLQGMARGAVGDVVFSRVNGSQVERVRNRTPKNPKTEVQVTQRARFTCAVNAFNNIGSGITAFAFEDKKQNESYYNAFMRKNMKIAPLTSKTASDRRIIQPFTWQVAGGSLPLLSWTVENGDSYDGGSGMRIQLVFDGLSLDNVDAYTLGEVWQNLALTHDIKNGDYITAWQGLCPANYANEDPGSRHPYGDMLSPVISSFVPQLQIDFADNTEIAVSTEDTEIYYKTSTSGIKMIRASATQFVVSFVVSAAQMRMVLTSASAGSVSHNSILSFSALVLSRVEAGGAVRVSSASLVPMWWSVTNTTVQKAQNIIDLYLSDYSGTRGVAYNEACLRNWGYNSDAILKGGVVKS